MDDADRATEIIERMGQAAERVEYVPPPRAYDDATEAWLAWAKEWLPMRVGCAQHPPDGGGLIYDPGDDPTTRDIKCTCDAAPPAACSRCCAAAIAARVATAGPLCDTCRDPLFGSAEP